ncbi:MAG: beta-lactamase family protein [bacterium]|nr:beta-lactamase family protein [bacterium]
MKQTIGIILMFFSTVCFTAAGVNYPPGNLESKLDQYLEKVTSEPGFSGTVMVVKKNRVVLHKGYGWADREKTVRIGVDTKFWIASITKQFTASAILVLREQGRLSVNDSIGKYFKDVPKDKERITLHHLLTHTSGIGQNYASDGIAGRDEAVRAILKIPLKNPTGERFGYSNDGYSLLAVIVETVSGQPYEAFCREYLLKPAGMTRTGFWGEALPKDEPPIAYTLQELTADDKLPSWGFRGGTGMFSTTGDLYKWYRALQANKVLKEPGKKKLFTPYSSTSRGNYTYGWFVSKPNHVRQALWTSGAEGFGHNAILKTFPDGTVIIVVSNAGNLSGVPARSLVSKGLEEILFDTKDKKTGKTGDR